MLFNCFWIMAGYLHTKCLYCSAQVPFLLTLIQAFSYHHFLQNLFPPGPIFCIQLCSRRCVFGSDWWNWVYVCLGMSSSPEHTAEFGSGSYSRPPTPLHKGRKPFLCFSFGSNSLLQYLILKTGSTVRLQTRARKYIELTVKSPSDYMLQMPLLIMI